MKNIVIIGTSGHAKVVVDSVEKQNLYKIAGMIAEDREAVGRPYLDYKIIGIDEDLPALIQDHDIYGAVIAIGDNAVRYNVVQNIQRITNALTFVTVIHPDTSIANTAQVGPGSVIMAGARINSCANIGNHCIVNTNASLDHDSEMMDFASLAPNAATGGNCTIGEQTMIGLGACIVQNVKIGAQTIIGAGSTVINDIDSFKVAYGTPAKIMRDNIKTQTT